MLVKLLFRASGTFIFCWWNFYFLLVELLFSAGGTFVFSQWNFYFILVELLFRAENTDGSSARNSPNESIIPLHPYLKVPVFPAKSDSNSS